MKSSERIHWLTIAIVFNFIFGIAFAKHLWLANRLYPLTPIFQVFQAIPVWCDYLFTPLLILFLVMSVVARRPRTYLVASLVTIAILFLQDQGRIFPSFYEYAFLLFLLAWYTPDSPAEGNSNAILNACRLAVICVYIWSGIQKMNPLFIGNFSWFLSPVTNLAPVLGALIPALVLVAPFLEVSVGIGLLFDKTRKIALAAALAMHASIFILIGPLRGNWNDSAWAWNLGSALIVFVLFFRAESISMRSILFNKDFPAHQVAFVFFGLLPILSLVNLWDSPLSFDVYSGNYFSGQVYVSETLKSQLPEEIQRYVIGPNGTSLVASEPVDLVSWSEDEFGANPYPVPRVFENIARSLCAYANSSSALQLDIQDKLRLSRSLQWEGGRQVYDCSDLSR
jgi:hypothetical protein